ncbi:hypothetical protein G7Y89_g9482 [Cudoniella acicularis]|uniref:Major facilitator superfamily (MFS) profile domain-containing protein n=1 Tax=Cudoniella acicularis TaxID=354080 RepID=A0A8H4REK2_9HELO|nr:hypothetical protein G7Y89_g9482 [Cudoniella acicularis]
MTVPENIESGEQEKQFEANNTTDSTSPPITNTKTTATGEKARPASNSKAHTHGETLPGWTIMRPLRMRGIRGSARNGNAQVSTTDEGKETDKKGDDDLKVTETNGSGDRDGAGEWLSFSANSNTVAQYYAVSESVVNWLSTAFLFAFVIVSPLTIYVLHRGGPKPSIVTASLLILLGNWIRYGATRSGPHGNFGGVMFGQILTGLAQPFVLSAPTRYSDLWFTNRGRVAATALMSLANPFGGALAQLIDPFWADAPSDIPNMVLYIAIISSIASIPSFFIPAEPPTPVSASGTVPKQPLLPSLKFLFTSPEFYMIMIPFTVYVGLFNSISSLINQMLEPYSFSETEAGIAGALLIVVGLVTSAVTSPIIDRTKSYLMAIKLQVPVIALCYLAFTWAPSTRNLGAVYAILSILGAASFSLVPVVLEYLIEITHPVSPEVTSTICWSGGQLLGGIFILISDALRAPGINDGTADDGSKRPMGNMWRALIFQTVVACVVVPLPLMLGWFGRGHGVRMRRIEADKGATEGRRMGVESGVGGEGGGGVVS